MRFLIQRVNHASVTVDDKEVGKIGKGLLVFVGVFEEDTEEVADKLIRKLLGLRIFADENVPIRHCWQDTPGVRQPVRRL